MEEERAATPQPATHEATSRPSSAASTTASAAIAQLPGLATMEAGATSPPQLSSHQQLNKSYKQNCEPYEHAATTAADCTDVGTRVSRPGTSATYHRHSYSSANIVHGIGINTSAVHHLHTDCDGGGHHDRDRDRDRAASPNPSASTSPTSNPNPDAAADADVNGSTYTSHDKQPHSLVASSACADTVR
ncbi:hypothetical protein F5B18DRAFT_668354 [Nemania serpens]|nr:hypothetical protein F5B18DRAFT_668354 [Nemania serpens]